MATIIVKNGKITILTKEGRQDVSYADLGVIDQDVATRQILKTAKVNHQNKIKTLNDLSKKMQSEYNKAKNGFAIHQQQRTDRRIVQDAVQVQQIFNETKLIDQTKVAPEFTPRVVPLGVFPDVVPVGIRKEKKNDTKIMSHQDFTDVLDQHRDMINKLNTTKVNKLNIQEAPEKSILTMVAKTLSQKKTHSQNTVSSPVQVMISQTVQHTTEPVSTIVKQSVSIQKKSKKRKVFKKTNSKSNKKG